MRISELEELLERMRSEKQLIDEEYQDMRQQVHDMTKELEQLKQMHKEEKQKRQCLQTSK